MNGTLTQVIGGLRAARRRLLCFSELVIYRGELATAPQPGALPAGFSFDLVAPQERANPARAAELVALGSSAAYARQKWERGEVCFALREGEAIVGVQWASPAPALVPEIGGAVQATPKRWYLHDLMISEALRGRRLSAPLVRYALAGIRERGGEGIFTLVETENYLSHRAMRRSGFTHAGRISFVRMGLLSWQRYTGYDEEAKRFVGC
jgi:ribosomal protein S18 acetylase RimI-like enzyme